MSVRVTDKSRSGLTGAGLPKGSLDAPDAARVKRCVDRQVSLLILN